MKIRTILLLQFLSLVQATCVQEHLVPDCSALAEPDRHAQGATLLRSGV
jgi:hypothetical protein